MGTSRFNTLQKTHLIPSNTILLSTQFMHGRIIELIRHVISMQLSHLSVTTNGFTTIGILRVALEFLCGRAIVSILTLLDEPASSDPEPDDETESDK